MRPFELLKTAIAKPEFGKEENDLSSLANDLLAQLDSELTTEDFDWESPKIVDLCDTLDAEIRDIDEADEDDEEDDADALDDDDDDDEFVGMDDDDDDEEETK